MLLKPINLRVLIQMISSTGGRTGSVDEGIISLNSLWLSGKNCQASGKYQVV